MPDQPTPRPTCDICNQTIRADERFIDEGEGGEIAHTACVGQWFRGNFGRETLHR